MLWSAITLAFGGFLRSDEYTQKRLGPLSLCPPVVSSIRLLEADGKIPIDVPRSLREFEDGKVVEALVAGLLFFVSESKRHHRRRVEDVAP